MTHELITRRRMLGRTLAGAGGLIVAAAGCDGGPVCYGAADSGLRKSLGYVEHSENSQQVCAGCEFFTAGEADCGHCKLFDGPANPGGYCTSWSARNS